MSNRYGNFKGQMNHIEECSVSTKNLDEAILGLRKSFNSEKTMSYQWRVSQLKAFKRMLREGKEELNQAMKKDLGRSAFEVWAMETSLCEAECDYMLSNLKSLMTPAKTSNSALNIPCWSTTQRDPLGLILIMGAWNYPVQLTLLPMVGAIAAGNCLLVKPGSYAENTSHAISSLINRFMDPSCIRVAEGNRNLTTAILKHKFDKICFTGSTFVGKVIARAAAEHLTPTILELGGKSPVIVDKSADIWHAAERITWGSFANAGQTCIRPDFCMVHEAVADDFFKAMQASVTKFYSSQPDKTEWFGRIINQKAFARLDALLKGAKDKLVVGGQSDATSKFIAPSVFDFGSDLTAFLKEPMMEDEIFGPLLPCVRFRDVEDAVRVSRTLPTGKPLALYVYTKDQRVANTFKKRTTSGGLNINDCLMHVANHDLPFGGVGESGMGAYHGHRSFETFSHEKAVLEKSQALDQSLAFKPLLAARFPPYTPTKQFLVRMFSMPFSSFAVNLPVPAFRVIVKVFIFWAILRILGYHVQIIKS